MSKRLLIVADDYGAHDSIDNGIIKAIKRDNIDCVAVLATMDDLENRIERLFAECGNEIKNGKVKIGLHLSLTCGRAQYRDDEDFLQIIEENGEFKFGGAAGILTKLRRLEKYFLRALELEMKAQYRRLVDLVTPHFPNFKPAHLSSHSGVFQSTSEIYRFYSKFAFDNKIHMRCPVLISHEEYVRPVDLWEENPSQKMFGAMAEAGSLIFFRRAKWIKDQSGSVFQIDKRGGIKSTDFFIEHFYKNGSQDNLRKIFDKIISQKYTQGARSASFELVIHPASYTGDISDMPDGVGKKSSMPKRKKELSAISQIRTLNQKRRGIKAVMTEYDIKPFKL